MIGNHDMIRISDFGVERDPPTGGGPLHTQIDFCVERDPPELERDPPRAGGARVAAELNGMEHSTLTS